jgi:hypothetical protein
MVFLHSLILLLQQYFLIDRFPLFGNLNVNPSPSSYWLCIPFIVYLHLHPFILSNYFYSTSTTQIIAGKDPTEVSRTKVYRDKNYIINIIMSVERKNPLKRDQALNDATSGQIGEEPRSVEEQTNDLKNERMKTARKMSRDIS